MTNANSHPQNTLEQMLVTNQFDSHEALVRMLEVLQHLKVGDGDPHRAEASFNHLLLRAVLSDGSLLERLLDEPRNCYLPARTLSVIECLKLLSRGDVPKALEFLSEFSEPNASQVQRLLASRFLLREERVADALCQMAAHADDVWAELPATEEKTICQFLTKRAQESQRPKTERRLLSLCAAVRNEELYLEEWVAFHHLIGVEQFYIYENESTDGTLPLLQRLARRFPIEIVQWKEQPANMMAYEDCIARFGATTEWLACIDADEFIMPSGEARLSDILQEAPADAAALLVNWRVFGSGGHVMKPAGLTLENYTYRAAADFHTNYHVKSIVRPGRCLRAVSPHHFLAVGRQFDASLKETMPLAGRVNPPSNPELTLHHYIVRSREDYRRKSARGRPDLTSNRVHENTYFQQHDRNEIADNSALKYLVDIQAILRHPARSG